MREFDQSAPTSAYFIGNVSIDVKKQRHNFEIIRSLGGSAFNAYRQAFLLGVNGELHAAIGGDEHGKYVLDEIRSAGMRDSGIVNMHDLSTLVYTQIDNGSDDVALEKSENAATDAHTTDMLLEAMPSDLSNSIVYIAGSTRKPSFMDEVFKLENFFDEISDRGATIAVDPGRTPEPGSLRFHRAQSLISHPRNLARVDFWAMNESEFAAYLNVSPEDTARLQSADHATMEQLADKYILQKASPALICVTLGKNGLFLFSSEGGSAFVEVASVDAAERKTSVGLGDSTKAGMIAAILHETRGVISPEGLAALQNDQLRKIGAYGSAVSLHRMTTETYGRPDDIAHTIAARSEHFAEYGITPDYLA